MKTKSQERSLAAIFMAETMRQTSRPHNQRLAALRSADFLSVPIKERDVAWLAHCIKRCPGYALDQEVAEAATRFIDNMAASEAKQKKFNQTLEDNPKLYAVPFPVMWVEWMGIAENGLIRNGLILENLPNQTGIRSTLVGWRSDKGCFPTTATPILMNAGSPKHMGPERSYPGRRGSLLAAQWESDAAAIEGLQHLSNTSYIMAMAILTILKSRTNIIKMVSPEVSLRQQPGVNDRNPGLAPGKNLGRLTFDLARTFSKGRAATEEEAKRLMAEQIVSGHFKLREVRRRDAAGNKLPGFEQQLIWWDPHWRGGTAEQKADREGQPLVQPREAEALISDNARPLYVPGLGKVPKPSGN